MTMEFDVYYKEANGSYNHSIVEAPRMSAAVQFVEENKGVEVYKAELREPSQKTSGASPRNSGKVSPMKLQ